MPKRNIRENIKPFDLENALKPLLKLAVQASYTIALNKVVIDIFDSFKEPVSNNSVYTPVPLDKSLICIKH